MLSSIMMNVRNSLSGHLEVRDIRISLNSQLERTQRTLELAEKYNKFLKNPNHLTSKNLYAKMSKEAGVRDKDLYANVVTGLKATETRLKGLIDLYDSARYKVLVTSSIATINLNALHLAAISDYYEKTCRAMIMSVSELESLKLKGISATPKSLNKYMQRNFAEERLSSMGSIISYNKRVGDKDIVKAIREMDDVEVTEDTLDAARAMGGNVRIDPTGFNYLNIINPTFWAYVGFKSYSELRLLYLDMEKDELEMMEARHQELVQLKANGESNMATDKLINDLSDRIDVRRYDIKELEESLG